MNKTYLQNPWVAGSLAALSVALIVVGTQYASAASNLFGGATAGPGYTILVSDTSNETSSDDYSGISFDDANGTVFSTLGTLMTDYDVTDDSCGGGSPRFQIAVDTTGDMVSDGNIFVYMGPSPNFTGCVSGWTSTGNLIGNEDAGRWDYTQLGGPLGGYSGAPANVQNGTILGISIVVDGSWSAAASGDDSEQTVHIDNVEVNSAMYGFTDTITVTIIKQIDGETATSTSANGASFPMSSTWSDEGGIGSGSGTYTLASNTDPAYEAETSEMLAGADYTTSEDTSGPVVGADCSAEQSYRLVGYTYGDSREEAMAASSSLMAPQLMDIQTDKFIMVWNATCVDEEPVASSTVKVYISKRVNGQQATAQNASSSVFTMNASWNDSEGIGSGSGTYTLDSTQSPAYQTETIYFNNGADYATSEVLGTNVGETCAAGKPYALDGYSIGESMATASSSMATTTSPSFTNLQSDKYVIVWNKICTSGSIGGEVVGGNGVLEVTSIESVDTTATADNSYENGWEYIFHITVPTDENGIAMKFSDWTSGSSTIPAANNMRISSAQADNGGATISIVAADTYTIPDLNMVTDLDPLTAGIQVEVNVEVKIPVGTTNGSYSTNYGVRSQ